MVTRELPGTEPPLPEIPGFQLLEPIGEGGMGRVYRAVQLSLQRPVAVKLLKLAAGQQPALAFQRESRLLASLAHPNLVTVFDCGQAGDHSYIVTELVPGSSLRPRMAPGQPWPVARACSVLDLIARALSYIHGQGILHLDLKPDNILGEDGEPKITDFGLAVTAADARALADAGPGLGTADYAAPEQRFGLPTSERSDQFSLAVLAYELLTGFLPGRVYESARQLNPALPDGVDRVLKRGLARSPEDRYPTVEEFRRDLTGALRGGPTGGRRRLAAGAAVALTATVAAFLVAPRPPAVEADFSAPAGLVEAWVLHDRPEQLGWFGPEGADGFGGLAPHPLLVQGRGPDGPGAPPLPAWPGPRPVLVLAGPDTLGFVHPLLDPALGRRVVAGWGRLVQSPPTPAEENFCLAGTFGGDCLTREHGDAARPWRFFNPAMLRPGDELAVADPPDAAGNPALLLARQDPLTAGSDFGCYQWLSRVPERAGTVVVMRYRARADEGEGRLTVRVELPLLLPVGSQDDAVVRLRGVSIPFPALAHGPGEEPRQYRLEDWVTPGREWRTYYVVWEWPPYCQDPGFRNLVVFYAGTGRAWLDDMEVFTWELGGGQ